MHILHVDDVDHVRTAFSRLMQLSDIAREWTSIGADSVASALALLRAQQVDLVLSDLRFPRGQMGGAELVQVTRTLPSTVPLMIYSTVEVCESERVELLLAGADEFMAAPLTRPIEFMARLHALARRSATTFKVGSVKVGNVTLDFHQRRACVNDAQIVLTENQITILQVLSACTPHSVSFADLSQALGYARTQGRAAVSEAVRRLRRRLVDVGAQVNVDAVPGFGYRLVPESVAAHSP